MRTKGSHHASRVSSRPTGGVEPDAGNQTWQSAVRFLVPAALCMTWTCAALADRGSGADESEPTSIPNMQPFADPSGHIATFSIAGTIDKTNPFFQSLGTNGRSCGTCHVPSEAFSFTPAGVRARFERTDGTDPIFSAVDGANCATVSPGSRTGRSLLLSRGLIRVALPLPVNAQFTITVVHDPYSCAIGPDAVTGQPMVSVYRRPLPSTNLNFLSVVMWDGRETVTPLNNPSTDQVNLLADLSHQVVDATLGHAQAAAPPTGAQISAIVSFELGLFTAQLHDRAAGRLSAHGATGGPAALASQPYYPGTNDVFGKDPTGAPFNPAALTSFAAWSSVTDSNDDDRDAARRAIAAGEQLFNSFPINITNVRGLNDSAALGVPLSVKGTCTTCHDTPNVGNHSLPLPLDIGTAHSSISSFESDPNIAAALAQLSPGDLPVYLINGCSDPFQPGQPASFYTTDPGKALLTGQCGDLNRLKGPVLRGLAARAPYFHNGAAADLEQVVNFYNQRFQMGLTEIQRVQLAAFLKSL